MDESAGLNKPGSDAELLNHIRSGDLGACDLLRARHTPAARRLAGLLGPAADAADETVSRAFGQVIDAIMRGGGPSDAFRPYLLSAVRREARGRAGYGAAPMPTDEQQIPDPGQPLLDPHTGPHATAVAAAFLSLPERWRAVLWHIEIEGASPAQVAPFLGLTAAQVAEIDGWARDGLDRGYRQFQAAAGLDERQGGRAEAAHARLDAGPALRDGVAPIFLGEAAGRYLADQAGPASGPRAGRHSDARDAGRSGVMIAGLAGALRGSSRQQRTFAAGACALLAVAGLSVYLLTASPASGLASASGSRAGTPVTGAAATGGSPATPAPQPGQSSSGPQGGSGQSPPAVVPSGSPAPAPLPTLTPSGGPAPSGGSTHRSGGPKPPAGSAPSGPSAPPAGPGQGSPASPAPPPAAPRRGPAAGQVTAQISVARSWWSGHLALVDFGVTNNGSAATAPLSATISLPPGTEMMSGWPASHGWHHWPGWGQHHRHGWSAAASWTCQASSGGAACTHPAMAPAARIGSLLVIWVTSPAACGQHVEVTVTSGAAPVSAQSAETISCRHW